MKCKSCTFFIESRSDVFLHGMCTNKKLMDGSLIIHISDAQNLGGSFRLNKEFGCILFEERLNDRRDCNCE